MEKKNLPANWLPDSFRFYDGFFYSVRHRRIGSSSPAAHEFASSHDMDADDTKFMYLSNFVGRRLLVECALMSFKHINVNVKAPKHGFNSFTLDCMIRSSKSIKRNINSNPD